MNMWLGELLFCLIFFAVPVVGMVGLLIGKLIQGQIKKSGQDQKERLQFIRRRKHSVVPVFASQKVMEYQMIDSQVHIPLQFTKLKERAQQRAGP